MKNIRRLTTMLGLAAGVALAGQDTAPPAAPATPAPAARPRAARAATAPAPPALFDDAQAMPAIAPEPSAAPAPPRVRAAWPATAPAPRALFDDVQAMPAIAPEAQTPPAAPTAPPAPAAPTPRPAAAIYLGDQDYRDFGRQAAEQAREMAAQVREQNREIEEQAREQARRATEDMRLNMQIPLGQVGNLNFNMAPLRAPIAMQMKSLRSNDGTLYGRGQNALDDHQYAQALDSFNEVVARGGPKVDGALYWKAYTLNKLGRRDESIATIAQLRTSFASSHWLEDAKMLELEVKQASGKAPSPESESDDELKLMALNGLSQTDPGRAYPAIEKLLKGPASPALKKRAVYVLASNNAPEAQKLLEQIARGNSNPDLQLTAIRYMVGNKQFPNRSQALFEIYGATSDPTLKREILGALRSNGDSAHMLQIYRSEKDSDLKRQAIGNLGDHAGNTELWQLYQAETTTDGKIMILGAMFTNGNTEKLAEVARTDKDPKVRLKAIEVLSSYRATNLGDTLASLYGSEQDANVKRAILGQISNRRNAKALVDIYHKESNFEMKKTILSHLGNMHTAEANELYMEILSK